MIYKLKFTYFSDFSSISVTFSPFRSCQYLWNLRSSNESRHFKGTLKRFTLWPYSPNGEPGLMMLKKIFHQSLDISLFYLPLMSWNWMFPKIKLNRVTFFIKMTKYMCLLSITRWLYVVLIDRDINFQINDLWKIKKINNLKVNNKCNSEGGDCGLIT